MEQVILELSNIAKSFGDTQVLKKINLKVMQGEFVTLLGSSGCGKTTTLRIIAGLEEPDRGAVIIDGTDMTDKAPNMRPVNTVFQNYAEITHNSETPCRCPAYRGRVSSHPSHQRESDRWKES